MVNLCNLCIILSFCIYLRVSAVDLETGKVIVRFEVGRHSRTSAVPLAYFVVKIVTGPNRSWKKNKKFKKFQKLNKRFYGEMINANDQKRL